MEDEDGDMYMGKKKNQNAKKYKPFWKMIEKTILKTEFN